MTARTTSARHVIVAGRSTSVAGSLVPTTTTTEPAEAAETVVEPAPRFDGPLGWTPGPLPVEPRSVFPPYTEYRDAWVFDTREDRAAALAHALSGVALGAYDATIITWLSGWDNPTVATVVSLIRRARLAATTSPPRHPPDQIIQARAGKEHP